MRSKTKQLEEVVRFAISDTKDSETQTRNRVFSIEATFYGKILLPILLVVLALYGSNAIAWLKKLMH